MIEENNLSDMRQLICFRFNSDYYCFNMIYVKAVLNGDCLIPMSNKVNHLEGAINFLEEIIPVINLKALLSLQNNKFDDSSKIIILNYKDIKMAFIADEITEVLRIPVSMSNGGPHEIDSKFIKATGKFNNRNLYLLNIEEVLSDELINQVNNLVLS